MHWICDDIIWWMDRYPYEPVRVWYLDAAPVDYWIIHIGGEYLVMEGLMQTHLDNPVAGPFATLEAAKLAYVMFI